MGFLFITAQQTEKLIVPDSIQKAKFAETVEKIANMDLEKVLTNLVSESIWVGLKIVLALAIYMAGRWLIGRLIKLLSTAFEKPIWPIEHSFFWMWQAVHFSVSIDRMRRYPKG